MAGIKSFFSSLSSKAPTGPVDYLVAGLGNPGSKYEATRHNAGYMALDRLAADLGVRIDRVRFKSLCGEAMLGDKRLLLIKPATYMNNSGQAVQEAMAFHKIPIERLLVLFDDVSLEVGHLRVRRKGSDGGHNGIKSIIYLTGRDTFPRIKIGVGAKPHPDYDLADWVLSRFSRDEQKLLSPALDNCTDIVRMVVSGRIDEAMSLYNGK